MGNPRYIKVGEQIKQLVASYLERRLKDPRLGFVTVTDVRMTGDSREATVFYTVMGGEKERADTAAALEAGRGLIRSFVGKQLGMKFTPTIAFILDAVPETAAEIEAVLAKARGLDAEVAAVAEGKAYAGEADPYKKPHVDDEDADADEDADE
jgi:ribosome-binding factor A